MLYDDTYKILVTRKVTGYILTVHMAKYHCNVILTYIHDILYGSKFL